MRYTMSSDHGPRGPHQATWRWLAAVGVVLSLLAAACGDDDAADTSDAALQQAQSEAQQAQAQAAAAEAEADAARAEADAAAADADAAAAEAAAAEEALAAAMAEAESDQGVDPAVVADLEQQLEEAQAAAAEAEARAEEAAAAAEEAMTGTEPAGLGQLDFMGFEGDDIPDFTAEWREANGVDFRPTYIASELETEAKILSGAASGVDIISFTSTNSPVFQESGILLPIDRSKLPNLAGMLSFFEEVAPEVFLDDNGDLVCIPGYWGAIGIAYDSSAMATPSAWSDLLDPDLTGRITTVDFPNPIFYAAAVANGIDPSQMSEADLQMLVDWLTPYMAQMKTFAPSFGDVIGLLASGEVDAVMPGFDFIVNFAKGAGNENAALSIQLAEGVPILASCQGIASTADNLDAAHAWLNNLLSPEVSAANAELQGGIATVEGAVELINETLRARYPYDDLAGYLESSDIITDWPAASDDVMDADDIAAAWAALKASAGS